MNNADDTFGPELKDISDATGNGVYAAVFRYLAKYAAHTTDINVRSKPDSSVTRSAWWSYFCINGLSRLDFSVGFIGSPILLRSSRMK